jgi:hypothetical protein
MKRVITIIGLTLLLIACSPTDPCRSHTDEASCAADKACQWNSKKDRCKTPKEAKPSASGPAPSPTPSPSEQAPPATGEPKPAPNNQ